MKEGAILDKIEQQDRMLDGLMLEYEDDERITARCNRLREVLQRCQRTLSDRSHTFAFVGPVGLGKTTAICHLWRLIDENGEPVLATGRGNTTLCDVELVWANRWAIRIDGFDAAETTSLVESFVNDLFTTAKLVPKRDEFPPITSEFRRFLTNALALPRTNKDKAELAGDLWQKFDGDLGAISNFYLQKLNLETRDESLFLCPVDSAPMAWLKEQFKELNLGKRNQSLIPKRFIIEGPIADLEAKEYNLKVVDTKGVNGSMVRASIDTHLKDPRTITMISSRFEGAPDPDCIRLFQHTIETGLRKTLTSETALFVIDKSDAQGVEAHDGRVENVVEGRAYQKDEIEARMIQRIDLINQPKLLFYNAFQDCRDDLFEQLTKLVYRLREVTREQVRAVENAISELRQRAEFLSTIEKVTEPIKQQIEVARESTADFSNLPSAWLDKIDTNEVNPSQLHAANTRAGSGQAVDYFFELSICASKRIETGLSYHLNKVSELLYAYQTLPDLAPAHSFFQVVESRLSIRWRELLSKADQLTAEQARLLMQGDKKLWTALSDEFGKAKTASMGSYKQRVIDELNKWFKEGDGIESLENSLAELVNEEWQTILNEVEVDLIDYINSEPTGEEL